MLDKNIIMEYNASQYEKGLEIAVSTFEAWMHAERRADSLPESAEKERAKDTARMYHFEYMGISDVFSAMGLTQCLFVLIKPIMDSCPDVTKKFWDSTHKNSRV